MESQSNTAEDTRELTNKLKKKGLFNLIRGLRELSKPVPVAGFTLRGLSAGDNIKNYTGKIIANMLYVERAIDAYDRENIKDGMTFDLLIKNKIINEYFIRSEDVVERNYSMVPTSSFFPGQANLPLNEFVEFYMRSNALEGNTLKQRKEMALNDIIYDVKIDDFFMRDNIKKIKACIKKGPEEETTNVTGLVYCISRLI